MPYANLASIGVHPKRPGPSPQPERPHDGILSRRHEPGLPEILGQPVGTDLLFAHDAGLVIEKQRTPLTAHAHGRVNATPVNLIDPPEPASVPIVIEIPSRAHPPMPSPYMPFHSFQGKVKPQLRQVVPRMLRHPVVSLLNLAHTAAPFIQMVKVKLAKASHPVTTPARAVKWRDGKPDLRGHGLNESELYKELSALMDEKQKWEEKIPSVSSLLSHESAKIQAKALWLLGEMGLAHPQAIRGAVPSIAPFLESPNPPLRERALNALGRIGRGNFQAIESYWPGLFRFASDEEAKVRLAFIWASENIATTTPEVYGEHMQVFEKLLHDEDEKVRMEAPEIFRVLGKRRPEFVTPYLGVLRELSETDDNRVVRIHCQGAIKATEAK